MILPFALSLSIAFQNKTLPEKTFPLQKEALYSRHKLGELAWRTLHNPDSVTVQAINQNQTRDVEGIVFALATDERTKEWRMFPYGESKRLDEKVVKSIVAALAVPTFNLPLLSFCAFNPDHLITFSKGNDVLRFASCFTCSALTVSFNGFRVSGGPLINQVRDAILEAFSFDEQAKAAAAYCVSTEVLKAIDTCRSGTVYSAETVDQFTEWKKEVKLGVLKKLDERDCRTLSDLISLASHSTRYKTKFKPESPEPAEAIIVTFDSQPKLEMYVNANSGIQSFKLGNEVLDTRVDSSAICRRLFKLLRR